MTTQDPAMLGFDQLKLFYGAFRLLSSGNAELEKIMLTAFNMLALENMYNTKEEIVEAVDLLANQLKEALEEPLEDEDEGYQLNG